MGITRLSRWLSGAAALLACASSAPDPTPVARRPAPEIHPRDGREAEAARELEIVLRRDADDLAALREQAEHSLEAGRPRRAAALLRRAVLLAPEDAELWVRLGDAEESGERLEAALAALDRALFLEPTRLEVARRRDDIAHRLSELRAAGTGGDSPPAVSGGPP